MKMKNKLLSILLTICMVALLLPVSVTPAYAESEVTKTYSLSTYVRADDKLSFSLTDPDDNTSKTVFAADGDTSTNGIRKTGSAYEVSNKLSYDDSPNVRFFVLPNVNGKVTKIEFTKACRVAGQVIVGDHDAWPPTWEDTSFFMSIDGMKYNGTDEALTGESHLDGSGNTTESVNFTFISTDPEGIEGNLSLWLGKMSMFRMLSGCEIKITYIPAAEPAHEHDFTYALNGNTLTATCGGTDGLECPLTNHQISTSLTADNVYDSDPAMLFPATLINFALFSTETGATKGNITYVNNTTSENLGTTMPSDPGQYTASITITAGGTGYTLTKTYNVYSYAQINNIYPQLNISTDEYASTTMAGEGQTVTITFTPKFGETLTGLTVTGATTNYSIGSGITDNGSNTYTFTMPAENVTIGATFSISEDDFAQSGDTYTIKTANGWDWFCFTVNSDLAPNGYSGKTVVLAASVGSSEMAGTSDHPFKGTFDGQGKTLTFSLHAGEGYSAPFHYTNGATIRNLHVEGTITGGDNISLGGLVGKATGNITIENCRVSTEISTTHSGAAWHGGVIALWYDSNVACTVTGCVYDGLIYNPSEADATTYCNGFIGNLFGSNLTVTFTDCLYAPAAYGTGEYAPGDNCFTFVYPNSSPTYNMTNCYYTTALGKRQGRPAATATDAPANLGDATTDHGLVKGYANGFLYNGNYYTPKYGDAVVEYVFNALWEHADVTINGQGNNLVGVNITEEVGNVTSVTYNRTFTSGTAAAVILPFDYTCNGNEGGSFYSFAGVSGTTPVMEDGNHVTSLTANTPYLFVPTATAMTFPNISKMTDGVVTLKPTAGDHTVTSGDWTLTGIYAPKTWTGIEPDYDNAFILNSIGKLNHISFDETVKPTDGYFVGSVITYTVTFDANGGTGTIAAETVTGGATYTLPACTFTAPEGKTFFAWSVKIGDAEAVNKQPGDTITVTADTTVTATWEWRLQDGYYLIGQNGWTVDALDPAQQFTVNPENENEYMLETTLAEGDTIKVVRVADGAIAQWYPDPGDNYTVTSDYAGSVTIYFKPTYDNAWSAFGGHIWIVPVVPSFRGLQLELSGKIGVMFNMNLPEIVGVDYADSYMTFTIPHGECTAEAAYTEGSDSFTCYINAIQMAEPITATFHYTQNGVEKTVEITRSAKNYFESYDDNQNLFDDKTQALIEATADYGYYTQAFLAAQKGWNLDGEDTPYAKMDKRYKKSFDEYDVSGYAISCPDIGELFSKVSFSLVLDSETAIRLYLTPKNSDDTVTASCSGDKDAKVTKKGARWVVEILNISAHQLSTEYEISVTAGDVTAMISVSALSYVNLMLDNYTDQTAQNAAAAIYYYSAAADAYKGN
jgi:hypothetical protein